MSKEEGLENILNDIVENETVVRTNKKPKSEKEIEKKKEEHKKLRKMFLEKEHNEEIEMVNDEEKRLKGIAVKGVLQLFNAISKHQHKVKMEKMKNGISDLDEDKLIDDTISNDDFLSKIMKTQEEDKKESDAKRKESKKKFNQMKKEMKAKKEEKEKKAKKEQSKKDKEKRMELREERRLKKFDKKTSHKAKSEKKPKKNNNDED